MLHRLLMLLCVMILVCPILSFAQEEQDEFALLEKSFEELLDVEITTASKTAEKIGDIPASVVVITREEIAKYGYQDLIEIISDVPGLFFTESTFHSSLGVRGFWTETQRSVMVLVNGIKVPVEIFSSFNLKNIPVPVESIDQIEIIRGPMSVMYGGGAFFGVINIITNDAKNTGLLAISGGSNSTGKGFARLAGQGEDFSFTVNASASQSDGRSYTIDEVSYLTLPYMGATENDREGYRFSDTTTFDFSAHYKGFYANALLLDSNYGTELLFPPVKESPLQVSQQRYYLGYQDELSEELSFDIRLGVFNQNAEVKYGWMQAEDFVGYQHYPARGWEANANFVYAPGEDINVQLGVDYRSIYEMTSEFDVPALGLERRSNRLEEDNEITTQAIYSQVNWRMNELVRIVAGVRLEQMQTYDLVTNYNYYTADQITFGATYDNDDIQVIPRLAFIFSPHKDHRIKLLYGKAILNPSFFSDHQSQTANLVDEGALEPEEVVTYELNYIGNINNNIIVSASLFRNEMKKLLVRVQRFNPDGSYSTLERNQGAMTTNGVELSLKAKWDNFGMEVSGSYQQTDNDTVGMDGVSIGISPEFLGYFRGYFDFTDNASLAVTGHYVSEMEALWDVAVVNADGSIGGRFGDNVDAYLNLGANLRITDIFEEGFFVNVRISNLLDEEIKYPVNSSSAWMAKGVPGMEQNFLVTMGYYF